MSFEPIVLKLKYPVEFGSESFDELKFSRLKARHISSLPAKPAFGDFIKLIGPSTGLNQSQVNELDAEDTIAAVEIVSGFFVNGRQTQEQ